MSGNDPDRTGKPLWFLGPEDHAEEIPEVDEATQERLGRALARYCDELVRQPVPDVLLSLLAKLEAKERGE